MKEGREFLDEMIEAEKNSTKKERNLAFDRISGKKPCLASYYDDESGPESFISTLAEVCNIEVRNLK